MNVYRLRAPINAYEVERISDKQRQFIVNGTIVIDAEVFHRLFSLEGPIGGATNTAVGVASPPRSSAPKPRGRVPGRVVSVSQLVRQALRRGPASNDQLRKIVEPHLPEIESGTIMNVLDGLRTRGEAKKRDADGLWELAPPLPDPIEDTLPGAQTMDPET